MPTFIAKYAFGLPDDQISEVTFIFWLVYYVERQIKEFIPEGICNYIKGSGFSGDIKPIKDAFDCCLTELTLLSKIKVLELVVKNTSLDMSKHIKYCKTLNQIRNQISHNKIDDLKYKNKSIKLRETKELMLDDLTNSLP